MNNEQNSLTTSNNAFFRFLDIDNRSPQTGDRVYITQHPSGRDKAIAIFDENEEFCSILKSNRHKCNADCMCFGDYTGEADVQYTCDTEAGSSGSPIISLMTHKVVAIHHCGGDCSDGGNHGINAAELYHDISELVYAEPTIRDTPMPTIRDTPMPTIRATPVPTVRPTSIPTVRPTSIPTAQPTLIPTAQPTSIPTAQPTVLPSSRPSQMPILQGESILTDHPSLQAQNSLSSPTNKSTISDSEYQENFAVGWIILGTGLLILLAKTFVCLLDQKSKNPRNDKAIHDQKSTSPRENEIKDGVLSTLSSISECSSSGDSSDIPLIIKQSPSSSAESKIHFVGEIQENLINYSDDERGLMTTQSTVSSCGDSIFEA